MMLFMTDLQKPIYDLHHLTAGSWSPWVGRQVELATASRDRVSLPDLRDLIRGEVLDEA